MESLKKKKGKRAARRKNRPTFASYRRRQCIHLHDHPLSAIRSTLRLFNVNFSSLRSRRREKEKMLHPKVSSFASIRNFLRRPIRSEQLALTACCQHLRLVIAQLISRLARRISRQSHDAQRAERARDDSIRLICFVNRPTTKHTDKLSLKR